MLIIGLIYNLSLLIAISVVSGFINDKGKNAIQSKILQGILFGVVAMIGMLNPVSFEPGLFFDARSVIISVCALLFGPVAVAISAVMAFILRLYQGGMGTFQGCTVIITSTIIGLIFYYRFTKKNIEIKLYHLFFLGFLVQFALILVMLTLPSELSYRVITKVGIPGLLIYSIATMFIGKIISDMLSKSKNIETIKINEEKYRRLVENIHEGLVIDNVQGKLVYANKEFCNIFGFTQEEFHNLSFSDFIAPESIKEIEERHKKRMLGLDVPKEFEYQGIRKDGKKLWIDANVAVLIIDNQIIGSQTLLRDITNKKIAEEELKASEEKFRSYVNNSPDGVFVVNEKGQYLDVNIAAIQMTGYDESELLNMSISDLLPPESQEVGYLHFKKLIETGSSKGELLLKRKDGEKRWWTIDAVKLDENRYLGFGKDINERKVIEESLRESNELNYSLLQTIPFGINIVDEFGNILFVSEYFKKYIDYDVIGLKCWETYRDDKKQCDTCPLNKGIVIGETDNYESVGVFGGKTFLITHTGMMFKGKKAKLEIFQDITERKKLENDIIQAKEIAEENEKLKTAFLQNMSHEIRTPLNGILGFTGLLRDESISNEEIKEYTEIIQQSSQRLLEIVNNVLDISKIETGQLKLNISNVHLNSIIFELYSVYNRIAIDKKINFNFHIDESNKNLRILTDETKLHQIINNLISNAFKFTKRGSIDFGYEIVDNNVHFFVKDTGIGIDNQNSIKVFERFIQVDASISRGYEGAGLGLAITKGLVELLGGKIWVESELGKGSIFHFTTPYKKIDTVDFHESNENLENTEKIKKIKILIAEDDLISISFLKLQFLKTGITVIHANDGLEAIKLINEINDIDLILMDIRMPKMNGYEAIKIIKSTKPKIPIIAQTAYAFSEEREDILAIGCDDYISKPIEFKKLQEKINKFINN